MNRSIFFAILIMAAVTYLIRMLPTVLLRKRLKNRYLLSLLAYLPYAVLGALTFPAVFYSTGNLAASVAGCTLGATVKLVVGIRSRRLAAAQFVKRNPYMRRCNLSDGVRTAVNRSHNVISHVRRIGKRI